MVPHALKSLTLVALFGLLVSVTAVETADINMRLQLDGGLSQGGEHRTRLDLECSRRNGAWEKSLWGVAHNFSKGQHSGTITSMTQKGDTHQWTVDMKFVGDNWVPGGVGQYTFTFTIAADGKVQGNFTGTLKRTIKEVVPDIRRDKTEAWVVKPNPPSTAEPQELAGTISGHITDPWPGVIAGVKPAPAGEHPRLAFRRDQLEGLRKRLKETDIGKAMMAQLELVLKNGPPSKEGDKFTTWPASGYAFMYQITGDKSYADTAKQMVIDTMFENPEGPLGKEIKQDIHHAPRLIGLALTYDQAGDGWDQAFRDRCALEIAQRVRECRYAIFEGKRMRGTNPNWWGNHNGIRVSAIALGALTVRGETVDGKEVLPEADEYLVMSAREIRAWADLGLSPSGWYLEGNFYKWMTFSRGWGAAVSAYRTAYGWDLLSGTDREHMVAGYLSEADPGRIFPHINAYDGHEALSADGQQISHMLFAYMMPTVADAQKPAVKYLAEKAIGAAGDKTYGIGHGHLAPFAVANWPWDVEAKQPDGAFQWMWPSPFYGHYIFRPHYRDGNDIMTVLNLKSNLFGGCHYTRAGVVSDLRVWGFGKRWFYGTTQPRVANEEAANIHFGPQVEEEHAVGDRAWLMHADTSHAYRRMLERKERKELPALIEKIGGKKVGGIGFFGGPMLSFDYDGKRSIFVDNSGVSGAPLLIAIADSVQQGEGADAKPAATTWSLPVFGDSTLQAKDDGSFVVQAADTKASVHGRVIAATVSDGKVVAAEGRSLVVFTLQEGAAPAITVAGDGKQAVVTVGKRVLKVVDRRLVVE